MMTDTIAAIATGLTESGIGVIRISGPDSYRVIQKLFLTKKGHPIDLSESHRIHYGRIFSDVSRETLDEVLVLNMKGPHSYTGEDTVEIDCHGGVFVMQRVLDAVVSAGARLADPGEFTKRAFLNGRMDLSQAEAVADVICAQSEKARQASLAQLQGSLSGRIRSMRATLLEDTAFIEAGLDDPEHIDLDGFRDGKLRLDLQNLLQELETLIASFESGRVLKEGIRTAIVGKPNAGKSSLLNALLGENRAIVTSQAGTTRDTLEETLRLHGLALQLVDTAGIRETDDPVEQIGVSRAKAAIDDADLVLYVVDVSEPLSDEDQEITAYLRTQCKKTIALLNKCDLPPVITAQAVKRLLPPDTETLLCSAKSHTGLSEITALIEQYFRIGKVDFNNEVVITSSRHREALAAAEKSLREVLHSIDSGMSEDFYTIDLMDAFTQLGLIIGEAVTEDLVNEIFSRFCMGK